MPKRFKVAELTREVLHLFVDRLNVLFYFTFPKGRVLTQARSSFIVEIKMFCQSSFAMPGSKVVFLAFASSKLRSFKIDKFQPTHFRVSRTIFP